MSAAEALELEAVLEQAQELVGLDELVAILAADVTCGDQRLERLDRIEHAQRLIRAAVHELEELHCEFDVAQAARAELELAGLQLRRDVVQHAPAHGLDVLDEGVAQGGLPHHRFDGRDVVLAQRQVARLHAGLELRLKLPGLRPAPVIRHVRIKRAHERAGLALRPQVRVDLKEARGTNPIEFRRDARNPRGGLGADEDNVHVRDVIELVRAALAQGHDGQLGVERSLVIDDADGDG